MKKSEKYWIIGGIIAVLLILPNMARAAYYTITDWLIPQFEGFRATPYWDISRYSWGYGTQAPGPTGTITQGQALHDMRAKVDSDYNYLRPLIKRSLQPNQWAALLSFAYNLGDGNADNLVANINSGDDSALETQWKKYIYAGGVASDTLVDRRNAEWQVWTGDLS